MEIAKETFYDKYVKDNIGEVLGSGCLGTVFELLNDQTKVLKVSKGRRSRARINKLTDKTYDKFFENLFETIDEIKEKFNIVDNTTDSSGTSIISDDDIINHLNKIGYAIFNMATSNGMMKILPITTTSKGTCRMEALITTL